ncbi:MAG: TonB-dependent receptor plug domain-containing protein [Chitinophagaceae bacterium]
MNRILPGLIFFLCISLTSRSQTETTDSSKMLGEVILKAFEQNKQLKQTAVAVNYINASQLERFNNTSILPALNSTPGVRMEERSPGSYRMNVRGSTLRSPFGVRNVKVYWNGIPFTDPGGSTYLNQLSYYNFNSIEIIKGPGGSMYGAGTGGVILVNGMPQSWSQSVDVNYLVGSYDLNNLNVQVKAGKENNRNIFGFSHTTTDGYRDHTNMRRDIATWQTQIKSSDRQQLTASVLYGDLYYQTPGALTKAEYTANPQAARPAAGVNPSADAAKAAIYQKTFLAGINNDYRIGEHFANTSVIYGAFSQIKNPTFRNYERRIEPHFGGRTLFKWDHEFTNSSLQILFGGEAQKGFFNTKTFANVAGNPGALLTDDDINNWIYSGFAQTDLHLSHSWNITAGVSINKSSITITRLSVPLFTPVKRTYSSEWAPRLAVSKKIIADLWLYASASKGFSPPTVQEVLPSTSVISTGLNAEHGNNYEAGIKSSWLKQRLYVEVNLFSYQLHNAIVQRKDASNADYFDNAGTTKQHGMESQAYFQLFHRRHGFIRDGKIWVNHTWNDFHYKNFKQGASDFSHHQLPSVARNTISAGLDITTKCGFYTNLSYFYSDKIALNDANSEFATSYNLFGGRIGWKKSIGNKFGLGLFAGADNLFDVTYSLGNDINAAGNRYYNAAAGRNYFAGISFQFGKQSQ